MEQPPAETPGEIHFISLLRGIASLLVVWDHLVAIWTTRFHIPFAPLAFVRTYITEPLGIIQDFGYLGVAIFFFVSGFIITHVAQRESRSVFALKRLLRIYPPLALSIVVIAVLNYVSFDLARTSSGNPHWLTYDNAIVSMPIKDVLFSMTLLNYLHIGSSPVSGVAWTLVIEMLFYVLCFAALPLVRGKPKIVAPLFLFVLFLIIYFCRAFGPSFFLFASSASYLPLLFIGQLLYFAWNNRISKTYFAALALLNYIVFIYGTMIIRTPFYGVDNSQIISSLYAFFIFVILLLVNSHLHIPLILNFFAKISYSLYLYHGVVGMFVLGLLFAFTGYPIALVVAFAVAVGVSYLSWRFVEEPSQRLARRIVKWLRKPQPVPQQIEHPTG